MPGLSEIVYSPLGVFRQLREYDFAVKLPRHVVALIYQCISDTLATRNLENGKVLQYWP